MPNIFSSHKLNPDYINNIFNNNGNFLDLQPINIVKKNFTEIKYKIDGDYVYVKLIDTVQLDRLSILVLEKKLINKTIYYEIKISKSYFNKRGYLKYLFEVFVVDYNYKFMSDSLHSIPGSMNFWKTIKKWEYTTCYIYNTNTKYKRKYINQKDTDIWGINKIHFIDDQINPLAINDMWDRKEINKDYYEYIINNEIEIKDRNDIRLLVEKIN